VTADVVRGVGATGEPATNNHNDTKDGESVQTSEEISQETLINNGGGRFKNTTGELITNGFFPNHRCGIQREDGSNNYDANGHGCSRPTSC